MSFKATGQGYVNAVPNAPANERTGNGLLKNAGVTPGDPDDKLWLYVNHISSQWTLQGGYSQTQGRRSFNPQHLVQQPLIVRGQMPNQYEYDRLVQFVSRHHETALGTERGYAGRVGGGASDDGGIPVSFQLSPYNTIFWTTPPSDDGYGNERVATLGIGKGVYQLPPQHVEGFITEIRAGAERFKNAPEFEFSMKITNDFLQDTIKDLRHSGGYAANAWVTGFGPFHHAPAESTSGIMLESVFGDIKDGVSDIMHGDVGGAVDNLTDAASQLWAGLVNGLHNPQQGD